MAHTVKVIKDLAKKYAKPQWNSVVTAIELVNERKFPAPNLIIIC